MLFSYFFSTEENCNNGEAASNDSRPWDIRFKRLCQSRRNHAAKVIRVANISALVPLLRVGVKVIQVIRDPRGTFRSRYRLAYKENPYVSVKNECKNMMKDMDYVRHLYKQYGDDIRKMIYFIRYEDIVKRPLKSLYDMNRFLDIKPDKHVTLWAEELQMKTFSGRFANMDIGETNLTKYYATITSTTRDNPEHTAHAWRMTLNFKVTKMVQVACQTFFNTFGYIDVNSAQEQNNISVSSMRDVYDVFEYLGS